MLHHYGYCQFRQTGLRPFACILQLAYIQTCGGGTIQAHSREDEEGLLAVQ